MAFPWTGSGTAFPWAGLLPSRPACGQTAHKACACTRCPAAVPEGQAYVEPYGLPSPIPDHDGTECLKWDPSLWSHADHFKVGAGC